MPDTEADQNQGAKIRTQRAVDELLDAAKAWPITWEQAVLVKMVLPGEAHD